MKRIVIAALALCGHAFANTCVPLQAGATDQTVYVTFLDETTGIPTAGLAFNSSGIDLEYVRSGAAATDITEATQTAAGAHSDGGFVSVGHGRYRLDLPDAAVATGVTQVVIQGVITGYILAPCTVALSPPTNVVSFGGTAGTFSSGRPEVNTTHWGGTAVASATVNGNVTQVSGDSGAADTFETWLDGTAGPAQPLGILRQGTAQSATSTTVVLDSSAAFGDDTVLGATVMVCGSTQGYCQSRAVTDYVSSTDTATVDTWGVTPSGTITYYLFSTAPSSGSGGSLTASEVWSHGSRTLTAATNITSSGSAIPITSSRVDASVGAYQSGMTPLQPTTPGRTLDVSAGGEAGVDWANVGSPTTSVSLSGTTVSTATTVGTVNALGNNSMTAAAAASDLTTELQSGLATASSLATLSTTVGTPAGASVVADIATRSSQASVDDLPTNSELSTALAAQLTSQRIITGTCDSGSTTTCVDDALTQAAATQLEDRLICFDDGWCGLITTFTPGSDTATTTKVAPSTRATKGYTIFPATLE